MQELRHARAIVDGIIVPEKWFAPELAFNARQMPDGIFARADFFASPENTNAGIEQATNVFKIVRRTCAEDAIEHGIVRVIARAHQESRGFGAAGDPVKDVGLRAREIGQIATHVVEQDRQHFDADRIEQRQLLGESRFRIVIEVAIELVRAQTHAETNTVRFAMRSQSAKSRLGVGRIWLAPAPAQEFVGFRRVEKETVAVRREKRDCIFASLVAPRLAVIALDDPEVGDHG